MAVGNGPFEDSVAKIFKFIKSEHVIAATTNSSRENGYIFYLFYLCSIVEYILFDELKKFATEPAMPASSRLMASFPTP
jgi:hypothetical protein